jgi:hypothetical protein
LNPSRMTQTRSESAKAVSVNWLFLHDKCPHKVCYVSIPHELFIRPVQDCQELFDIELKTRHNFKAKIHSITFLEVCLRSFLSSQFLIPGSLKNQFS